MEPFSRKKAFRQELSAKPEPSVLHFLHFNAKDFNSRPYRFNVYARGLLFAEPLCRVLLKLEPEIDNPPKHPWISLPLIPRWGSSLGPDPVPSIRRGFNPRHVERFGKNDATPARMQKKRLGLLHASGLPFLNRAGVFERIPCV